MTFNSFLSFVIVPAVNPSIMTVNHEVGVLIFEGFIRLLSTGGHQGDARGPWKAFFMKANERLGRQRNRGSHGMTMTTSQQVARLLVSLSFTFEKKRCKMQM